ncbi:MAG: hypothetical protein ACRDNK_16105 [Solirubrobacteraceae bacterium]
MRDPNPPPELRSEELLAAFERRRVQFLIVGGFGAQLHGATRQTKDVDVCPAWDAENLERLAGRLRISTLSCDWRPSWAMCTYPRALSCYCKRASPTGAPAPETWT